MPRALISVSNKNGLVDFAQELHELGWDIVASGGTEKLLADNNIPVTPVQQLTNLPEMLGGRVKTLHPAIHAGILARDTVADVEELQQQGYAPINMVVCNLYPFQETVAQASTTLQDATEKIDIGGVTLLRAAAKNFFRVTTVCDPADYPRIISALRASGDIDMVVRRDLAVKAFALTRDYDTAIHAYLAQGTTPTTSAQEDENLPDYVSIAVHKVSALRYGENPHQSGAYYSNLQSDTPFGAKQFGGKELSYNNILDVDAAWRAVSSFDDPTVVIVKHLTPTGIASAATIAEAYPLALRADPLSAFGCVMAVNRTVDDAFVEQLGSLFIEVIIAPSFTPTAKTTLNEGRKNCRLLQMPQPYDNTEYDMRSVLKGFLIQRRDAGDPIGTNWKTVTDRPATAEEMAALQYAWKACNHVRSNAIIIAQPNHTLGTGGGLPSRVDAAKLAIEKAGEYVKGAVMASEALIPFPDVIEVAAEAGITALIQPGGAIRDKKVIEAANQANMAMIFTGVRHFRH
ncbi:bifunctional phosphoribosylaminoimidazolecarboxamide formyltransferase/IMP cyclohydrolase [Phototrophicus methaneseepsis]|uniref:Bifunctional purine biosynthesis protein PurH n=1 Tax=Phototrophicus methaneseepsis TaxID=2710758 RepID=A0A7S8ID48_9CHLR|nr:bifunctional phosphoribosylaminoimidazolecarboxamide formyltransferase/IMP cyclohydrolase [Phototrophicus methaneseepsis]QPC80984.1 bifunctional phosphoribosylaminoimidazolecarboxamide formyltransferase/IMP cyclohydrolase [Phototrophicus methaneseepsis]